MINNSNSNNDFDNDKLFFKIWRNIYLLDIIFKFNKSSLYEKYYNFKVYSKEEFENFEFRDYITILTIGRNQVSTNYYLFGYSELLDEEEEEEEEEEKSNGLEDYYSLISSSKSINELRFSNEYNKPIYSNYIPENIKKLVLPLNFNQKISRETIPVSITSLVINDSYDSPVLGNSISHLVNLKSISFGESYNHNLILSNLPNTLEELDISGLGFKQSLEFLKLFKSLRSLSLGRNFHGIIKDDYLLSTKLKNLSFEYFDNDKFQSINSIPPSVTRLSVNQFKEPFTNKNLPKTITILKLTNIIIPNTIPPIFKSLEFSDTFNQYITFGCLPDNLESVTFGKSFNQMITPLTIPQSITQITLSKNYNQLQNLISDNIKLNFR